MSYFRVSSDNVGLLKSSQPISSVSVVSEESDASGKPKLIRQAAILPDADSAGSHKSVTFQVQRLMYALTSKYISGLCLSHC